MDDQNLSFYTPNNGLWECRPGSNIWFIDKGQTGQGIVAKPKQLSRTEPLLTLACVPRFPISVRRVRVIWWWTGCVSDYGEYLFRSHVVSACATTHFRYIGLLPCSKEYPFRRNGEVRCDRTPSALVIDVRGNADFSHLILPKEIQLGPVSAGLRYLFGPRI